MTRICNRMGPRAIKESFIARGHIAITCLSHKGQNYRLRGNRSHARFFLLRSLFNAATNDNQIS